MDKFVDCSGHSKTKKILIFLEFIVYVMSGRRSLRSGELRNHCKQTDNYKRRFPKISTE